MHAKTKCFNVWHVTKQCSSNFFVCHKLKNIIVVIGVFVFIVVVLLENVFQKLFEAHSVKHCAMWPHGQTLLVKVNLNV